MDMPSKVETLLDMAGSSPLSTAAAYEHSRVATFYICSFSATGDVGKLSPQSTHSHGTDAVGSQAFSRTTKCIWSQGQGQSQLMEQCHELCMAYLGMAYLGMIH